MTHPQCDDARRGICYSVDDQEAHQPPARRQEVSPSLPRPHDIPRPRGERVPGPQEQRPTVRLSRVLVQVLTAVQLAGQSVACPKLNNYYPSAPPSPLELFKCIPKDFRDKQ